MKEIVRFRGHPNVRSIHKTTIEVTKDRWLTPKGDCIIGISADKACSDISPEFKNLLRKGQKIRITIIVEDTKFSFTAHGDPRLELSDNRSIVIRKSKFISPRTLAIQSEAAAIDIPRKIIELLKKGKEGKMVLESLDADDLS